MYIAPPADGIWDVDFVITPPPKGVFVTQMFSKHTASLLWPGLPGYVRGFRIHAASNSIDRLFDDAPPVAEAMTTMGAGQAAITKDLEFRIDAPRSVTIDKQPTTNPKPAVIDVELNLLNAGTSAVDLTAPTPCQIYDWQISGADNSVVQSYAPGICNQVLAKLTLEPGEITTQQLSIILDKNAYQSGTYTLHATFWGSQADSDLNVEVTQ